jgi:hypothetical protein
LFSKIVSAVTEAGRTATEEDRSAAAGLTASPPPETVDLKAAWNEADQARRLWEAQLKRAQDEERKADAARRKSEEERSRLDERERQLEARAPGARGAEEGAGAARSGRSREAEGGGAAEALGAERRELLARRKELQDQEFQLTEREENARVGFVAQQASALAELRQRKTELEAELQALPAKLSEVYADWVKDVETPLRQRLDGEARQAREQLATELAGRRRQAEQEL